jgi:hypothetical protein
LIFWYVLSVNKLGLRMVIGCAPGIVCSENVGSRL